MLDGHRKTTLRRWGLLLSLAVAACGGSAPTTATPPPPPPPPPAGPTLTLVNFPTAPLQPGEERQLGVDARDSTGAPLPGLSYTWRSSNPAVATVLFGKVVARAVGTTQISATSGTASSAERTLQVVAPTPLSIVLSPDSLLLRTGTSQSLTATVEGSGGIINLPSIQWSVANPAVATVDGSGRVTAVAPGVTVVLAMTGSITASVRVVVADQILNLSIPELQLIQVAQSKQGDLAMVVGKPTAVRVYPAANLPGISNAVIRVVVSAGGGPIYTTDLLSGALPVGADPTDPFQGLIAPLPEWIDLASVGISAIIDPDDLIEEIDETDNLGPQNGSSLAPNPIAIAPLRVRLIPIAPLGTPQLIPKEITQQEAEAYLAFAASLLPVPMVEVSLGESAITPTDWSEAGPVLNYIESRRISDGFDGLYLGVMYPGLTIGPNRNGGYALIGGNAAVAAPNPYTIAHEIGHNLSLIHPPGCGIADAGDPFFPYPFGIIGIPGWNGVTGELQSALKYDIMSYCGSGTTDDRWISDYSYGNLIAYLLASPAPVTLRGEEVGEERVQVAGVVRGGEVALEAPTVLAPEGGRSADGGDVLVEFLSTDGATLSSWRLRSYRMSEIEPQSLAFTGIVPIDPDSWARTDRVRITVAGAVASVAVRAP
jgi:hypothetical protein